MEILIAGLLYILPVLLGMLIGWELYHLWRERQRK